MNETKAVEYQMRPGMSGRASAIAITAILAFTIVALACIVSGVASVILILDAIPFHHLFGG